jgi:hypothetical protein
VTLTFEITVQEGYSDRRGERQETLDRGAVLSCVPRVGDTVETGYGTSRAKWVDWDPWAGTVFVRLDDMFSLGEPFDDVVADLRKEGWS